MEWTISYIGVAIAALFAALGGAALGVMFGLSERRAGQRRYARILASMGVENGK